MRLLQHHYYFKDTNSDKLVTHYNAGPNLQAYHQFDLHMFLHFPVYPQPSHQLRYEQSIHYCHQTDWQSQYKWYMPALAHCHSDHSLHSQSTNIINIQ